MAATGQERRWKERRPDFNHGRRLPDRPERDSQQPHKSVAMAPKSRCLTERRYAARKPLFSTERHASILKKTHPSEDTEQEKTFDSARREEKQQQNFLTGAREAPPPERFHLPHGGVSSSSVWREGLGSPLGVSELQEGSAQRSPPSRPRLTSTVLYPSRAPRLGRSRTARARLGQGGRAEQGGAESKVVPMSPYQANYWACAIPEALPPSPDRHSSSWDPNGDYRALLDYTYPLRPGPVDAEWDCTKLHGDALLLTDPNWQDSGIEPDHLCGSSSLTGLGLSLGGGHRSPDPQAFSESSEAPDSSTLFSRSDPAGLSLDSENGARQRHLPSPSSLCPAFIRSTSLLPRSRGAGGEVDEEFRPLPEQLEELQLLSRQVREATAHLSWESLGSGTTSVLSSIALAETQEDEDEDDREGRRRSRDAVGLREGLSAAQTAADWDSKAWRRSSGAWAEPVGGANQSSLGEVEALAERLGGAALTGNRENQEQGESLMRRIQVFSSLLEQLIQQLYAALGKVDLLAPPTVAEYQESAQQPLTSSVLHAGRLLLSCVDTASPFLGDALLLIERRSGALETHMEDLSSSILSTGDDLTRLNPLHQGRGEEPGPVGVQTAQSSGPYFYLAS
ncbi:centrosomal protein of 68 kDa [Brachionichthys hirsutus]|uniref:centrosomal protein of 68 kDa n=1 Tax=Brachionichthys hirsutus TaxID=412623 RepID=UPI0036045111